MSEADRAALDECLRLARADPTCRQQIDSMLEERDWREVAEFAAYGCQRRALKLKPWQSPPCWGNEDDSRSIALLNRMLEAGLSAFEPSPLEALAKAKRQKR